MLAFNLNNKFMPLLMIFIWFLCVAGLIETRAQLNKWQDIIIFIYVTCSYRYLFIEYSSKLVKPIVYLCSI